MVTSTTARSATTSSRSKIDATETKADRCIKLLQRKNGATLSDLQKATGWQAHSVRGFVSGTIKKRMGHFVISEVDGKGVRRYRVAKSKRTS